MSTYNACRSLTSITIPASVTSIGDAAFAGCFDLASVNIPASVTSIGREAFQACNSLTLITIPEGVTFIGDHAFSGCSSLTSIIILANVISIGEDAFKGCKQVKNFYCYAIEIPTTSSDTFTDANISNATLHVPAESIGAYKSTAPWSGFGNIIALTEEETAIGFVTGNQKEQNVDALYDLNGRKISKLQRGINIVRSNDGSAKKVMVK